MPSSNPETIPAVIELIWNLAPKSVLDIGAGYGKYGVLFREYLELRLRQGHESGAETNLTRGNRLVCIDAVEGFADYVGDLHRLVYDNVYIENILDFVKREWEYDIIFMGDVLEHMEKHLGVNLLSALLLRAKMGVLIIVPMNAKAQPAQFGNELEAHRSKWSTHDFRGTAPFIHAGRKGGHLVAFLTKQIQYYQIVRGNRLRSRLRAIKRAMLDSW